MSNILKRLHGEQRGITGLETAIILIAFVVVASVFAYTVLSAGIFSSQKGKEAINSGLEQTRATMSIVGGVIAKDTDSDSDVDQLVFMVSNALDGEAIALTTTSDADADGILSDESTKSHKTIISYMDSSQRINDITWTKTQMGKGDSDNLLEPGEKFEITVVLTALTPVLDAYDTFRLEMKPDKGSTLTIERTIPAKVDAVRDLN